MTYFSVARCNSGQLMCHNFLIVIANQSADWCGALSAQREEVPLGCNLHAEKMLGKNKKSA